MYIFAGGEGALIAAGGSILGTAEIHWLYIKLFRLLLLYYLEISLKTEFLRKIGYVTPAIHAQQFSQLLSTEKKIMYFYSFVDLQKISTARS
jgi:hypothetical protein